MNCEVNCIEVSQEGYLKGYAISHSGLWDAYMVDGDNSLLIVGRDYHKSWMAVHAVEYRYDWRKDPEGGSVRHRD